jgi:hypothetical protein
MQNEEGARHDLPQEPSGRAGTVLDGVVAVHLIKLADDRIRSVTMHVLNLSWSSERTLRCS